MATVELGVTEEEHLPVLVANNDQGLYKEDKILGIHFPGSTGGN